MSSDSPTSVTLAKYIVTLQELQLLLACPRPHLQHLLYPCLQKQDYIHVMRIICHILQRYLASMQLCKLAIWLNLAKLHWVVLASFAWCLMKQR